jgi:hypothetical protein
MNNENELKSELEKLDYKVEVIPRGNTLSADYIVKLGATASIIEVKTMNDTENSADEYFSKLQSGIVFEHVNQKDTRKNVSKAVDQISTSYEDLEANGYKIICIYSNTIDSNIDVKRRLFDFYGGCEFFGMKLNTNNFNLDMDFKFCYGFYNSIFLQYKSLDGAFIMSKSKKIFLPNFYSNKYKDMMESDFFKPVILSSEWEVHDPIKQERDGQALILDNESLSVRNNNIVELTDLHKHERSEDVIKAKNYLERKYHYSQLSMEQNRGKALVLGSSVS